MTAASHSIDQDNEAFKKALRLLSSEGLDGAMMVVERELESDAKNWEAWSAKADIHYFQKDYDAAMKCCVKSLSINPDNALTLNIKGNILYKLGRYKEAIECYNMAIDIEPLFVRAWYNKKMASEIQLKKSRLSVHFMKTRNENEKRR